MMRVETLLVVLVWVTVVLSGCHGLDITGPDESNGDAGADAGDVAGDAADADPTASAAATPTATPTATSTATQSPTPSEEPPGAPELELSFVDAPATLGPEASLELEVEATGDSATADVAEVVYDTVSSAGADREDLDPAAFAGRLAATPEAPELPGSFTVESWDPDAGTTYYLRAHVQVGDAHYWSSEHRLDVDPVVHTVEIGTVTQGVAANFAPRTVTINVGEAVQWTNRDSTLHNAQHDDFATANLEQDETSDAIVFDTAGTFNYICGIHPNTMSGTVEVEA